MPRTYVYTDYGGPENQQFIDLPKLSPGPQQLLVAVRAAGVNPADWKRRAGLRREVDHLAEPAALGLEVAGVVEALGDQVEGFAVGDQVFGSVVGGGGFAEYALLSTESAALKPATVSFADASTLPVAAATAYDGINQLDLAAGETVLITGVGGGVGVAAAQIALGRNLRVIGTASEAKRSFVESLGVTFVAYGPDVLDRVRNEAPEGVDAIYDLVGGEALRELAPLVRDAKKIVAATDPSTATSLGGAGVTRERNSAVLQAVVQLVANGSLKPFVTGTFPLDRAGEALALVEDGHATGKIIVEVI